MFDNLRGHSNLFIVSTPYHLMVACVQHQKNDVLVCVGLSLLGNKLGEIARYLFADNLYIIKGLSYYRKNFLHLLSFKKEMKCILMDLIDKYEINNIYAYNDADPVTQYLLHNMPHHGEVVIIEEGIGLYRTMHKRHEVFLGLLGQFCFGKWFENIHRIGESSFITQINCSMPCYLSNIQKTKKINIQQPIDYTLLAQQYDIAEVPNVYWFVGQPLVEDGVLSEKEYIKIIEDVASFCHLKGMSIILKPHPRENLEKYSHISININHSKDVPIELLVDSSNPILVFTMYSSAVLTLSERSNVKAFLLYKIYMPNMDLPNELFQRKGVHIINSFDEII